jgi:nicotinamidase-related amidase
MRIIYLQESNKMSKVNRSDSAMVLIDHQTGTMGWIGSIPLETIKANTRALAKVAMALDMPIVFTSSMEDHQQGPLMPELEEIASEAFAARIKRPGVVNCWDDPAFADACRNTGRKQFIMAGVTTDVCLAPPAISASEEKFDVFAVVDASGSPTNLTDEMAFRRMERANVELTTTSALISELAQNWASPEGMKLIQILGEEVL